MFRRCFFFGAMLAAVLAVGCGSRRAVSPTTEPVDGGGQIVRDGQTVAADGREKRPKDAFVREEISFDTCASTICNGKCTDTDTDPNNCGACGVRCAVGSICHAGGCSEVDLATLQLNGTAFLLDSILWLTPAKSMQNGSAFTAKPFPATKATSFKTHFRFRMHGGSGADGLAFVLHNDPRGSLALASGGQGGDLAYADSLAYKGTQIVNSLAVEFDTWSNGYGGAYCDPNDNHVGIGTNGTFLCTTQSVPFDLDSGSPVYAWIDYSAGVLHVYLSTTPAKPSAPILSHNVNLAALVGNQAFVGFTAATGDISNAHDIESWAFFSVL